MYSPCFFGYSKLKGGQSDFYTVNKSIPSEIKQVFTVQQDVCMGHGLIYLSMTTVNVLNSAPARILRQRVPGRAHSARHTRMRAPCVM